MALCSSNSKGVIQSCLRRRRYLGPFSALPESFFILGQRVAVPYLQWPNRRLFQFQCTNLSRLDRLRIRCHSTSNERERPTMEAQTVYSLLKLSTFTKSEIDWRFDRILKAGASYANQRCFTMVPKEMDSTNSGIPVSSIPLNLNPNDASELGTFLVQASVKRHDNLQNAVIQSFSEEKEQTDAEHSIKTMTVHDLEAYLFERYLIMEEKWNAKSNHDRVLCKNNVAAVDTHDEASEVEQQVHASLKTYEQQKRRIKHLKMCAESDAASIFELLLSYAHTERHSNLRLSHPVNHANNDVATIPPIRFTKHQFYSSLYTLSTQIHYPTIAPLAASMLLVGASVGVISPIMPFVATKLQLTSAQYGIVVSSFALSKMMGNVPSAILVERHGRKPFLVHSLFLVGLGVAGLGLASDWIQLSACRMTIGLGVAALTTASTLTVADVSTPLSRASTFSPVMSAFAGGTALGPAIGGLLCDKYGIKDTFLMVGASYGVVAVWNSMSLRETGTKGWWDTGERLPWHEQKEHGEITSVSAENKTITTITQAPKEIMQQWSVLLNNPKVRPLVIMNGFYLCAISGTQMTLLPLLLTGGGVSAGASGAATGMALTATAMGQIYMWMSAVQVLGNPVAGRFADRAGKHTAILAGGIMTSASMAMVPVICAYGLMVGDFVALDANDVNWPLLAGTLGIWSLGGTLLASSHASFLSGFINFHYHLRSNVAAISDAVSDSTRSQAIALLRTAGDVGFLCGAAAAGLTADIMGDVGFAMQAGSAVLMGATGWFGLQTIALWQIKSGSVDELRKENGK